MEGVSSPYRPRCPHLSQNQSISDEIYVLESSLHLLHGIKHLKSDHLTDKHIGTYLGPLTSRSMILYVTWRSNTCSSVVDRSASVRRCT